MRTKQIVAKCCSWMLLFSLLAACGTVPTPTVDNVEATKIVATFMAQITQTAAAADDLPATVEPTETLTGESPEDDETPAPTATPDPYKALLDRFRLVSVINGNLFVRNGTGLPVQITKSGADHDPVISADGQKIVFYRDETFQNVFIINADGSNEKSLINTKLLPALSDSKVEFLTFRPGTSDLLFSSYSCGDSTCNVSIFLVGSALTKIAEVTSALNDPWRNIPKFAMSTDGQYLSIIALDQIDLYNLNGKIAPTKIMGNPITGMPSQYWMPDSHDLIVLVYVDRSYAVLRYTVGDDRVKEIQFKQEMGRAGGPCSFFISLDRIWIFYRDRARNGYLGNLKDVQTQPYVWDDGCSVKWSPDSQHFASQTAIGSVDGTPPITIDGHFIAWLDDTHYLFTKGKNLLDLQSYIAEVGKESAAVQTNFIWSPVYAVLP